MDYLKAYDTIIGKARERNAVKGGDLILESHHVVPKACGGSNSKSNLVNLTLREHYVCHLLLERIYRGTAQHIKMLRALFMLGSRIDRKNSRLYEQAKDEHIRNLRKQTISDHQKEAIRRANKGNRYGAGVPKNDLQIRKLKEYNATRVISEATKEIWSEQRKGKAPWNKNNGGYKIASYPKNRKARNKLSDETIERMKKAREAWWKNKKEASHG